jgi:predicted transcriptional regulator
MIQALRRPEQILAYRPLRQILAAKSNAIWSVTPDDKALAAMRLMAEKNIGLVLVLDGKAIAGVLSERDCVRRLVVAGKSPETTPVSDIMVRDVVTADIGMTFADCLKLMHSHGVRHLPVTENGVAVAVISVRDLLSEAVAHQAKVISELELERLTMLTSTA